MPLAKYITDFLELDEAVACKGVRDDCYTPDALKTFLKHDDRPAVRDQIDAKINQAEMALEPAKAKVHTPVRIEQVLPLISTIATRF